MELQITIPGKLDPRLSPNASRKMHWGTKTKAREEAKGTASLYTRQAMHGIDTTGVDRATYHIELGKAHGEKQKDADNLTASCKATLDAIAETLGVDDRGWTLGTVTQVRDPEKLGYVRITLVWDQNEEQAA